MHDVLRRPRRRGGRRRDRAARDIVRAGDAAGPGVHGARRAELSSARRWDERSGWQCRRSDAEARSMKCPFCGNLGDKVVDSRESKEGNASAAGASASAAASATPAASDIEEIEYRVIKKDGSPERVQAPEADRRAAPACEKRPVSVQQLEGDRRPDRSPSCRIGPSARSARRTSARSSWRSCGSSIRSPTSGSPRSTASSVTSASSRREIDDCRRPKSDGRVMHGLSCVLVLLRPQLIAAQPCRSRRWRDGRV